MCDENISDLFLLLRCNFFLQAFWDDNAHKVQIFFALKIFWQQVTNDKMHLDVSYAINCKKIHLTHLIAFNIVWGIQRLCYLIISANAMYKSFVAEMYLQY